MVEAVVFVISLAFLLFVVIVERVLIDGVYNVDVPALRPRSPDRSGRQGGGQEPGRVVVPGYGSPPDLPAIVHIPITSEGCLRRTGADN
jgi:hypothetical protein